MGQQIYFWIVDFGRLYWRANLEGVAGCGRLSHSKVCEQAVLGPLCPDGCIVTLRLVWLVWQVGGWVRLVVSGIGRN